MTRYAFPVRPRRTSIGTTTYRRTATETCSRGLETQWEATLDTYPFDFSPPDDNRPFFFHFFRWAQLPQVIADLGKTWQPFGGSGFLLMFGLLLGISLLAMLLTCSPYPSRQARGARLGLARSLYFALVGAGFMLVEVPLLQQASLVLVQPAVALALIVCVLLMASGVGSLEATRARLRRTLRRVGFAVRLRCHRHGGMALGGSGMAYAAETTGGGCAADPGRGGHGRTFGVRFAACGPWRERAGRGPGRGRSMERRQAWRA